MHDCHRNQEKGLTRKRIKMVRTKNTYSDLLIILIWITITLIFITNHELENSPIRTILGIPMVIFIPGYVLVASLFPRKGDLGNVERIALGIGMSIAIVPLLGLLLSFTIGIRLISVVAIIMIYSIFLIIITIYRRKKLSKEERFSVEPYKIYRTIVDGIKPKSTIDVILTVILISTVIAATYTTYYVITSPKMGEKFTEFYVLGENGKAINYTTDLKLGSPATYMVGISNHEHESTNYTLQILLDKQVLTSKEIFNTHNETWEDRITVEPDRKGTNLMLEFWLFKGNDITNPYRSLHLWVNST